MTKAKSSKRKVKPCPVPSDLCNDICMYGTPCIRPRLWRTAYEQGKKESLLLRNAEKKALAKTIYEEVLKDVHRRFELARKYHNRRALSDMGFEALEREYGYQTEWLEQRIKELSKDE
jgi:hypothetical protein